MSKSKSGQLTDLQIRNFLQLLVILDNTEELESQLRQSERCRKIWKKCILELQ